MTTRRLLLALLVCLGMARGAAAGEPVAIAVSYFENSAAAADLDPLKKGFADMLITDLGASDELVVVERARLEQVLGEIALQKSPYVDKATAVKLGKGLGAAYLLTGAFLVRGGTLRVDVRVIDVQSGEVVFTAKQEGKEAAFFDLEQALAEQILGGLGAKLSLLQKKRIGGTKSFGAFRKWSLALDARDRGDPEAEKEALAAALAADPEYQRAKARVAELEKRVTALETSAGRILRPASAADHIHNARIAKGEGKYEEAAASLAAAAALDPAKVEIWLLARELSAGKPVLAAARGLDRAMRPLVEKYLAGDAGALVAAAGDGKGRFQVQAAALLLDLAAPALPAPALRGWRAAMTACDGLLGADAARLRAAFVDFTPFLQRTHATCDRPFDAAGRRQVEASALIQATDPDERWAVSPWWDIEMAVVEPVTGGITVSLQRDAAHPHWHDKPAPQPKQYLRARSQLNGEGQKLLDAAVADPTMLIVQHGYPGREARDLDPIGVVALGDTVEIEARDVACERAPQLLTGKVCRALVRVYKPDLPPGAYIAKVQYADLDGTPITTERHFWAFETELIPARSPDRNPEDPQAPIREVHVLGPEFAKYAGFSPTLEGPASGGKAKPAGAVTLLTSYFRVKAFDKDHRDVATLSYDVDFALVGGKPPADGDTAAWIRYRDQVFAGGWRVDAAASGLQWLPLPVLKPGVHYLCVASVRTNGSKTPEAECHRVEVEK